jgi:hypothetical protein
MSVKYSAPKMVVVKFREEAQVRVENEAFTTADADLSAGLEQVLTAYPDARVVPLFTRPAADLATEADRVVSGVKAPNLNLYYRVDVAAANAETLAEQLRGLPGVAMAYVEPDYDVASKVPDILLEGMVLTAACPPGPVLCPPAPFHCPPAPFACPPAPILLTPDLSSHQIYLEAASAGGLDARYAWTKAGGKGANMHFADTEFGWNVNHEDLNTSAATPTFGTNTNDDHGTAVLGEIVSEHNGYGVMGIAPDAQVALLCSISDQSIADCINHAAAALSAGDVILIELQTGFRPVEKVEANYDAIVAAVASGVIVVEAAGNGMYDLDAYVRPAAEGGGGNILRRSVRDSGAIMVGAGCPPSGTYGPPRSRWQYSNFGSRLDVQGQGREVYTCGYGDAFDAGPNRKYTADFSQTSAASPQIVGAVLCIQGIRKAKGDAVLTPTAMRDLLINTGSPQVDGDYGPATQHIGPQPDLLRAYRKLYPIVCPPAPFHCPPAPVHCPPAPFACPPAPFVVECKPSPFVLKCPPAPDVLKCPPAPKICSTGPTTPCAAGPGQGWEDPHDWEDPIFEYRYIEDIGHVLILVRKSQLQVKGPADAAAAAAQAAAYGYDQVYWSYNTADIKTTAETSAVKAKSEPPGEFRPTAQKRKK